MEEHRQKLSDEDYLIVKYNQKGDEVTYMLIVYYSVINEVVYQIFRVDMSHGFLHKDKLYELKKYRVKEKIHEKPTVKIVWDIVDEISEKWMELKRAFIRNKLEERK